MLSTRWLDQRTPHWRRLDALLERSAKFGLRDLSHSELQELGMLYRQVAADLATVREDPSSARIATSLNQLLARAHHTIYSTERPTASGAVRFLREAFPRAFRANIGHCAASLIIFLGGAAVGLGLSLQNPDFKARLLGPQMIETIERHEMWTHSIVAVKPLASSAIMTNNLSVSFMAFAMGITAGLGTIYMLFFNGLLLGVVGTACWAAGLSVPLWSFVAPHGVLELPAIVIAGGGGLRLAHGLLFPGLLPRRLSLRRGAIDAVTLVLGCVPILIVAGVIEAFLSPTDLAVPLKFAFAAAMFALLLLYLFRFGSAASHSDSR